MRILVKYLGMDSSNYKHALLVMKDLGITYQQAIPQTLFDCWEFLGCDPDSLPEDLPEYVRVMK
jgi:hypothetical protein